MSVSLSNLIWISEKRKNLLLLLNDGPRSSEHIVKALNTTFHSISPQLRVLIDEGLVYESEEDVYNLTSIGKLIVSNMYPLFTTLYVLEEDLDYWKERNLSNVPDFILERIGELGTYMIMEPDQSYHYAVPEELQINLKISKKCKVLLSYYHPVYIRIIEKTFHSMDSCDLILSKIVFERLLEEERDFIYLCLNNDNKNIYVYDPEVERTTPSIFITEIFSYFLFFNRNQVYDNRQIMSFDDSSLKWGCDLFDYYRFKSVDIDSKEIIEEFKKKL